MSLRWRWALGLGVVAALAIGLITIAAVVSAERQLRGAVDSDLRQRASELARLSGAQRIEGRVQRARLLPRIVDLDAVVQALDEDGAVLLQIGPEGVIPPVEAADLGVLAEVGGSLVRDVEIAGVTFRMITFSVRLPTDGGPSAVAFQIATDRSRVDANLTELTRRLVTIGVLGVLLVGFTGWLLASRAVRPITDLTDAAERIASSERIDAGGRLDMSAPGEIGRLARAFSSMLASLRKSREEQQRLVTDAGHEFRTPITSLTTNLEVLRRQGDRLSRDQSHDLIEAALAESRQLAGLAAELVDLSTDAHHTDEPTVPVDMRPLADEVADRFRQLSGKEITVSGVGATVKGRRSQLERALGNLVDNAAKWAGSAVEIVLDGPSVTVVDDGPGIPEEAIAHIFDRFYRSSDVRSSPGTGLGLSIVEHLIVAHGGKVTARNGPGGGAEVGFTLPVVPDR
ncbi:MAG: ATP-binding protein [bacterium]|nr:ATP-binding protein [bacterium]MDE0287499.1 ATP-binding protein [bacterium]MDE0437176.1 ATP-binding protein [bacterium]